MEEIKIIAKNIFALKNKFLNSYNGKMNYSSDERRDTPLAIKIKKWIEENGCLSVSDYMETCLYDKGYGYYANKQILGSKGDFITAPEISQIFGELIGLWCAVVWELMGSPASINLVELGPGRGTLMFDALRAARINQKFLGALSVHLVEVSPFLAGLQKEKLKKCDLNLTWHETLKTVPEGPTVLFANEFLDTWPVTQRIHLDDLCYERVVGLEEKKGLVFLAKDKNGIINKNLSGDNISNIHETQNHSSLIEQLKLRISNSSFAALFIDYGYEQISKGETLQAIRSHCYEHPLCSPGEADLSVQVNFSSFKSGALNSGFAVEGPFSQSDFLIALGLIERASRLMRDNPSNAGQIEMDVKRLLADNGMGKHFKVICLRSTNLPALIH